MDGSLRRPPGCICSFSGYWDGNSTRYAPLYILLIDSAPPFPSIFASPKLDWGFCAFDRPVMILEFCPELISHWEHEISALIWLTILIVTDRRQTLICLFLSNINHLAFKCVSHQHLTTPPQTKIGLPHRATGSSEHGISSTPTVCCPIVGH